MIFSCGENWKDKLGRLTNWYDFYAIFPRIVDTRNGKNVYACFCWIERRGVYMFDGDWVWSYRLKESI